MTAHHDPDPQLPMLPEIPRISHDIHRKILALRLDMHRLLAVRDFATSQQFRDCIELINDIESDLKVCHPGQRKTLAEAFKARGSMEECVEYCLELGLPPTDGEWFYYKMSGCGWRNGKLPVRDWRSTVRAWKLAGYMASQRQQNPMMRQRTIIQREVDR